MSDALRILKQPHVLRIFIADHITHTGTAIAPCICGRRLSACVNGRDVEHYAGTRVWGWIMSAASVGLVLGGLSAFG